MENTKTVTGEYTEAEHVNKHTHLFAYVLHHELELSGVFTLTIEQVPPQSRCQHTVIRQDSLQTQTHIHSSFIVLLVLHCYSTHIRTHTHNSSCTKKAIQFLYIFELL